VSDFYNFFLVCLYILAEFKTTLHMKSHFLFMLLIFSAGIAAAQINVRDKVKSNVLQRAGQRLDEAVDKGIDVLEGEVVKEAGKNKKPAPAGSSAEENGNADSGFDGKSSGTQEEPLKATGRYDFVPGDKILFFEDFSQDAPGDFPALWTTNSSGEINSLNIAPGHWFYLNGEDAVYNYTRDIVFPSNFILEFDLVPDDEYAYGITLTLYEDASHRELNDDLYPGDRGLHIRIDDEVWETKGYNNLGDNDWITGESTRGTVSKSVVNHVIIWIQNRRVRIYHGGMKTLDMPTNIYQGTKFNRLRFSGWDSGSWPFVSNIKITTASPDTRSKLITEGRLVTYGIVFDVNKADPKPESEGTLQEIAGVLKENPALRVKIVGHTDSDGDEKINLDLSGRRAASVKNALVKIYGIDASRLETEGAGESKPLVANDTPVNKAQNRRVEFLCL